MKSITPINLEVLMATAEVTRNTDRPIIQKVVYFKVPTTRPNAAIIHTFKPQTTKRMTKYMMSSPREKTTSRVVGTNIATW